VQVLDALVVCSARARGPVQPPSDELVVGVDGIDDGRCILLKACRTADTVVSTEAAASAA
jgi:hypothetical protein